jgi:hypothetical protein
MSQGTSMSILGPVLACIGLIALFAAPSEPANADDCVKRCRAQHNSCRMAAKLLSSAQCDSQLQACISRCVRR